MWVFRVGFSYVFALGFDLGVLGVWLAMFSDWIFRGTLFMIHFLRGKWLTKYKPLEKRM
jgi:Na+-driven multidrug efflux pump